MSNGRREIVGGWKAVPLTVINDPNLNHLAKFLYTWLITRPDDWDFSVAGTATASGMARSTVDKYLGELQDAGYVRITEARDEGRFSYVWTFYSEPGAQTTEITGHQTTVYGNAGTTIEEKKVDKKHTPLGRSPRFACDLPDDWVPNEIHIHRAKEFGLDLKLEAEKFRNYYVGHGKKQKDWDRTFHNWLIKAYEYKNPLPSRATTPSQRGGGWLRSLPDE